MAARGTACRGLLPVLLVVLWASCVDAECCEDVDPRNICVQKKDILPPRRPLHDQCFFDPFEDPRGLNVDLAQKRSLTWNQAREVCRSLKMTLPIILSEYSFQKLRERYMLLSRIWIGVAVESPFRNVSFVDLEETAVNRSIPLNYTNWAKYEPNNAGCYEKCVFANYDTTWNDYACDFIPIWDNCSDVIYTICHNSSNKNCIWYSKPTALPFGQDWYIVLAITFGYPVLLTAIFGAVMLLSSVRFLVEQCSKMSK